MQDIRTIVAIRTLAAVACAAAAPGQGWQLVAVAGAPSARNATAIAFDDARGHGLLFGGYDAQTPGLGDTWRWDGASWQQQNPAHAPSPRWGHGLLFDRLRNRVVLFGGYHPGNGLLDDTWEWDGVDWIQRVVGTAPAARMSATWVYDRARDTAVLFGGLGANNGLLGDTWTWNGTAWTQRATAGGSPVARRNAAATWDDTRRAIVLFGGLGAAGVLADTWTWEGAGWTSHAPSVSPPARQAAAMAFDPLRTRATLFGGADATFSTNLGDAWEWDGGDWRIAAGGPAARHGAVLVHDPRRGALVLFGGRATTFFADTWQSASVDATANRTWLPVMGPGAGAFASDAAMAWDGARNQLILHGGSVVSGPPPWSPGGSYIWYTRGETRRWQGSGWVVAASGPARAGHGIVHDELRGRLVMFGGYSGGQPFSFVDQGDTWVWAGLGWTQVATTGPGPRSGHGMAYDASRDRVVVFGGVRQSPFAVLGDTWEWDGVQWAPVTTPSAPPPRQGMAMAYDPVLARTVLHGGAGAGPNESYGDTWEFDGVGWVRWPGGGPTPRHDHRMVFDTARGCLVAFGGFAGVPLDDTWHRLGRQWSPARELRSPAPRSRHAMAYDQGRQRTVVALGQTSFADNPADTWEEVPQPAGPGTAVAVATTYGQGCGSPMPRLLAQAGALPVAGGRLAATVAEAPFNVFGSAPAAMSLGLSSLTSPLGPLPYPLAAIGAPGCWLLHAADVSVFLPLTQIGGSSYLFASAIPNHPAVLGLHVYGQAWFFANLSQITVTNAIDWQLGNH